MTTNVELPAVSGKIGRKFLAQTRKTGRVSGRMIPLPALPALSISIQNELPVLFHDAAASMTRFRDQISPRLREC